MNVFDSFANRFQVLIWCEKKNSDIGLLLLLLYVLDFAVRAVNRSFCLPMLLSLLKVNKASVASVVCPNESVTHVCLTIPLVHDLLISVVHSEDVPYPLGEEDAFLNAYLKENKNTSLNLTPSPFVQRQCLPPMKPHSTVIIL